MPEKVHQCVRSVLASNPDMEERRAWAVCNAQIDTEAAAIVTLSDLGLEAETLDELANESNSWTGTTAGWLADEGAVAIYDDGAFDPALSQEGESLGARLRELIDEAVTEDTAREDVVDDIVADSGGMDRSTINAIIEGEIQCPPPDRFRAFSEVLDTTMDELLRAAEEDGCEYDALSEEGRLADDADGADDGGDAEPVVIDGLSAAAQQDIEERYGVSIEPADAA